MIPLVPHRRPLLSRRLVSGLAPPFIDRCCCGCYCYSCYYCGRRCVDYYCTDLVCEPQSAQPTVAPRTVAKSPPIRLDREPQCAAAVPSGQTTTVMATITMMATTLSPRLCYRQQLSVPLLEERLFLLALVVNMVYRGTRLPRT
jgi:hypothetical protein